MKLFRISNILILMLAALLGTLLFWTSQSVQEREDHLAHLKNLVAHESESINVLTAEWDYLNRPQRLEELAKGHFDFDAQGGQAVLSDAAQIATPTIPPAPRAKPASFTMPVKQPAPAPQPVIQQPDSQRFDALLKALDEEGGAQ